ncbi:TPA: hypothetical protein DDW35_06395 [Candidatus Sumerlaeota bacterium]|nr:hypothetical protein [Candidatus Sumerlaeota bacterium]
MDSGNHLFNKTLFEICQAMGSSLELSEVLTTILDLSLRALEGDAGSILLYESGSDDLKMLASRGLPPKVVKRGHINRKGSVAEWVIQNDKPVIVNKRSDIFPDIKDEVPDASAVKTALCAPLHAKGKIIGVININRYVAENSPFAEEELNLFVILASQAAVCIENARLFEENVNHARMAAVGQTVAGISHCVKNILGGLFGGLGNLELACEIKDWTSVSRALALSRSSASRISLLVMDMLDYTKEKKIPIRQWMYPAKTIQEVFDICIFKAQTKRAVLETDIAMECTQIFAEPNQLFRCLLNLVENALDALPREGTVRVICKPLPTDEAQEIFGEDVADYGKICRLSVEDNGSGIAPEHLDRIFEPLFSTKESKGTGLGLAVTKKIVLEHGGRMTVESTLGKGTAFHMILPEINPSLGPQEVVNPE